MTGPHSIQQKARVMASAEQALRSQDGRAFLARNAQAIADIRAERLAREAMEYDHWDAREDMDDYAAADAFYNSQRAVRETEIENAKGVPL